MTPIRGFNLKKLFGKLTPYADDIARGAANYGDDALRLASNYGDEALDYGVDLARVVDKYDDDVARAFNSNVDIMDITPKGKIATGVGSPPPIKKPLFEGDVRMNADSSLSVLSADDVYNIENDWLTQDMLSRGELNNVGTRFQTHSIDLNDLHKAGYGRPDQYGMLHPDVDADIAREYNALRTFDDPYAVLSNPTSLNWGGAEGAQNMFQIRKYIDSVSRDPYGFPISEDDTIRKLFNTLVKRDAAGGLPNLRDELLTDLLYDRSGEFLGYGTFLR